MKKIAALLVQVLLRAALFGDEVVVFTIDRAVSQALNCNRQLKNVYDTYEIAGMKLTAVRSSFDIRLRPVTQFGYMGGGFGGTGIDVGLGLESSKKFMYGPSLVLRPLVLKSQTGYNSQLTSTLTVPLLRGFGRDYNLSPIAAQEYASRTACRNVHLQQMQLVLKTVSALYEIEKQKQILALNIDSRDRLEKALVATSLKDRLGFGESVDIYRVEMELKMAQDGVIQAEELLLNAKDQLKELLNVPLCLDVDVDLPLVISEETIPVEQAVEIALENRIEIDQAEDDYIESRRNCFVASESLRPQLDLILRYDNTGCNQFFFRSCYQDRINTWSVGLNTGLDCNTTENQMNRYSAIKKVESSKNEIELTKTAVALDVKKSWRALEKASQNIHLQEEKRLKSEGEYLLSQMRYERGLSNNFDMIAAEKNFRTATIAHFSALVDHVVGEYRLLNALGIILDKPR